MRLLHITATHLEATGGIPVVLRELVEAQNKINNFQSRVVSLRASIENVDSQYFDYCGILQLNKYLDTYLPDLVIIHSYFYWEYAYVGFLCSLKKIPYFIEPHGSFGKSALQKSAFKKCIANYSAFWNLRRNALGIIFLNNTEKDDSVYRTVNDVIIPNGINTKSVYNGIINKSPNFYFIGRYDIVHKGLDVLLDAMEIIDKKQLSYNFYFWGKGDKKDTLYFDSRLSTFKFIKVFNEGPIYDNEKRMILEQFGPMLLTSRYEGFPMSILEAWAYGNPCIVTPGTNVYDEILNNNIGWTTELNPICIATTIEKAHRDYKQNRNNYIINCKDYVSKKYNWESIAIRSYNILLQYVIRSSY